MILLLPCHNPVRLYYYKTTGTLRLLESLVGLSFLFVCSWYLGDGCGRLVSGLGSLASWYLGDGCGRLVGGLGSLASWYLGNGCKRLVGGF